MLAIVIPFYKINFFEENLASLASQTNKNFNVYIGDDASPDNPEALIGTYKNMLNITYKRFDENLGGTYLTKQWDRCLDLIKEENWVILLCDDDLLSENVVEEFFKKQEEIKNSISKVVRFATQEINEKGEKTSNIFTQPQFQNYNDVFYSRFFGGSRSSLSEHIFSVDQYKKYGFRDLPLAWHADDLAWLEFSEFGPVYTIDEALLYFRISTINISRPNYLLKEKQEISYVFFSIVIDEYLKKFKKETIAAIIKKYELMTYAMNKGNFGFLTKFLPIFLKHFGLLESIKFSRRVFLNRKRNE